MPAARMTPVKPKCPVSPVLGGMNGTQLCGLMNGIAPMTMATIASIFMPTTMSFTRADSDVPRMISHAVNSVISTAGMSMTRPLAKTCPSAATESGAPEIASGRCRPKLCSVELKYPLQPMATSEPLMRYSSSRHQPIIQATPSPIVA